MPLKFREIFQKRSKVEPNFRKKAEDHQISWLYKHFQRNFLEFSVNQLAELQFLLCLRGPVTFRLRKDTVTKTKLTTKQYNSNLQLTLTPSLDLDFTSDSHNPLCSSTSLSRWVRFKVSDCSFSSSEALLYLTLDKSFSKLSRAYNRKKCCSYQKINNLTNKKCSMTKTFLKYSSQKSDIYTANFKDDVSSLKYSAPSLTKKLSAGFSWLIRDSARKCISIIIHFLPLFLRLVYP